MDGRTKIVGGALAVLLTLMCACFGANLEDERFSCFGDEDCDPDYQCRLVDERRVCMANDSADVRLCEEYCDQFIVKCGLVGEHPESSVYADRQECLTACDAMPTTGNTGDTSGDTVQCRFYHIGVASQNDTTHCPHAWPFAAAGGCTGVCFDFCRRYQAVCGAYTDDAASQEQDLLECRQDCDEFQRTDPEALGTEPTGNTLECRQVYLDRAEQARDEERTDDQDTACLNAMSPADSTEGQCR